MQDWHGLKKYNRQNMNIRPIVLTYWGQESKKLQSLEKHLRENDITNFSYFYGIQGKGLRARKIQGLEYFTDIYEMSGKCLGQNLSHWHLWSALKMEYERHGGEDYWNIFEDDIRLDKGWEQRYMDTMEDMPGDWDIILFGNCCSEGREFTKVTDNILKGGSLCLHWYAVRYKALDTLRGTNDIPQSRVDIQMALKSYKELNVYTIKPRLAGQFGINLPL
jgi:GR25 family glycosyltransferase involved in LPS biosynthesis